MDDSLKKHVVKDAAKAEEYFKLKKASKTLRRDLAELKIQHDNYDELETLKKKVKKFNEEINDDPQIKELKEKIKEIKERQDLLKEMIRIELIENSEESVKQGDRALKLVYVVKEVKSDE